MPKVYAREPALRTLLMKCTALQSVSLTVAFSTLVGEFASTDARAEVGILLDNRKPSLP